MKQTPITPKQAINNFKLLLKLPVTPGYSEYRRDVQMIASTCIQHGIASVAPPSTIRVLEDAVNTLDALAAHLGPAQLHAVRRIVRRGRLELSKSHASRLTPHPAGEISNIIAL